MDDIFTFRVSRKRGFGLGFSSNLRVGVETGHYALQTRVPDFETVFVLGCVVTGFGMGKTGEVCFLARRVFPVSCNHGNNYNNTAVTIS